MPVTPKGFAILKNMVKEYGAKKGKSVFYASSNKGAIKGVHGEKPHPSSPTQRKAVASGGAHEAGHKDQDPEEFAKHEAKESPEVEAMEKKVNKEKGTVGFARLAKNVHRPAK